MNNNMSNNMSYNMNSNMNNNLNNNVYNNINGNKPQCNPNLFTNNYINGNNPELNNITYSKNAIDNGENKIQNIVFIRSSGIKKLVKIHSNCTIYQLIKKYMTKIGLSEYDLRRAHLRFIYNAKTIDPFSNELIREKIPNGANIYVLEEMNLIGRVNYIKIKFYFDFFKPVIYANK